MDIKIFLLLACVLYHETNGDGNVILPGGGVVGMGNDVVFKYQTGDEWFMCNFYRYEPVSGDQDNVETEFCSYINRDGAVSQLKCDPESLGDHFEYTGTSPNECTITVKNITMRDDCKWATRLASDLEPIKFDIIVAMALESVSIDAPTTFVAGQPTDITCVTKGGSPKPQISFGLSPPLETPILPNDIKETYDEVLKTRSFTATITPEPKDHGKKIQCSAQQFDKADEPKQLFGKQTADPVVMDVTFPPQPVGNAPFKVKLGESVLVGIELLSNPKPDKIEWSTEMSKNGSDNETGTGTEATTTVLENGDKYTIVDLVELGDQRYRADLTIKTITEEDPKMNYYLTLTNSVGTVKYGFSLTTDEGMPGPISSNLTMFILVGVGCILILVAILVAVYKKCIASGDEEERQRLN